MAYEVEVFYDPRTMDVNLLQGFYGTYGLKSPRLDELKKPFFKDEAKGIEVAATKFAPLTKGQALELSDKVLDIKDIHVEIHNR